MQKKSGKKKQEEATSLEMMSKDQKVKSMDKPKKKTKCGTCPNCIKANCGSCTNCQDMKMFGGPGKSKQSCKMRKCLLFGSSLKNSSISTLAASSTSVLASSSISVLDSQSSRSLKKKVSFHSPAIASPSHASATIASTKSRRVSSSSLFPPQPPAVAYTMSTHVFLKAAITFFNEF